MNSDRPTRLCWERPVGGRRCRGPLPIALHWAAVRGRRSLMHIYYIYIYISISGRGSRLAGKAWTRNGDRGGFGITPCSQGHTRSALGHYPCILGLLLVQGLHRRYREPVWGIYVAPRLRDIRSPQRHNSLRQRHGGMGQRPLDHNDDQNQAPLSSPPFRNHDGSSVSVAILGFGAVARRPRSIVCERCLNGGGT